MLAQNLWSELSCILNSNISCSLFKLCCCHYYSGRHFQGAPNNAFKKFNSGSSKGIKCNIATTMCVWTLQKKT